MYAHIMLDIKELRKPRGAVDPVYDIEEQEYEYYEDPDFDKIWDSDEEYEKDLEETYGDSIEKSELNDFKGETPSKEFSANLDNEDEWEEV